MNPLSLVVNNIWRDNLIERRDMAFIQWRASGYRDLDAWETYILSRSAVMRIAGANDAERTT